MTLKKLLLITACSFPVVRILVFKLFHPDAAFEPKVGIQMLVEMVLFVPAYSLALWHMKYKGKSTAK